MSDIKAAIDGRNRFIFNVEYRFSRYNMNFRAFIAICAGKLVKLFCRIVHKGGTAKPGEIALRIYPELLTVLAKDVKCTVITGTNGKTTCTRIVEEGMHRAGLNCFANRSGANLIKGIATDFIDNSSITGKCRYEYAVLETDEAASVKVCLQLQPAVIFVTNLFRDQVDRFGGVEHTRDCIRAAIKNSPSSVLVLNADCPVTASLAEGVPNRSVFYGFSANAASKCGDPGVSDLKECINCGESYEYAYKTFSHLGGFRCPKCGAARPAAQYEVTDITEQSLSGSEFTIRAADTAASGTYASAGTGSSAPRLRVNLPAIYNIYNGIGSYAALRTAGADHTAAADALAEFKSGFGRMESLAIGKKGGKMILVKNDAGCNQVLRFLRNVTEPFVLSLYINNNVSDGVDISWLKDAEFEILKESSVKKIFVSGMRIEETYARLSDAGIPEEMMEKQPDCPTLIKTLNGSEDAVFIMPTYTGMMESRAEIIKQCGGTEFWEG